MSKFLRDLPDILLYFYRAHVCMIRVTDWLSAEQTRVEALAGQRVVDIACGETTTVAITAAGALYVWGTLPATDETEREWLPQMVDFPECVRVRHASCGSDHIAAVANDGRLFTWGGALTTSALGHGTIHDSEDEERESDIGCGSAAKPQTSPRAVAALAGHRLATVSCGAYHTAAVTEEGQLWIWGRCMYGRLGLGGSYGSIGCGTVWLNIADPHTCKIIDRGLAGIHLFFCVFFGSAAVSEHNPET